MSNLFLNLLLNQAMASGLAAKAWFGRRFRVPTRVVCTCCTQDDELRQLETYLRHRLTLTLYEKTWVHLHGLIFFNILISENRHIGATNMNEKSSRSHTIFKFVSWHLQFGALIVKNIGGDNRLSLKSWPLTLKLNKLTQ